MYRVCVGGRGLYCCHSGTPLIRGWGERWSLPTHVPLIAVRPPSLLLLAAMRSRKRWKGTPLGEQLTPLHGMSAPSDARPGQRRGSPRRVLVCRWVHAPGEPRGVLGSAGPFVPGAHSHSSSSAGRMKSIPANPQFFLPQNLTRAHLFLSDVFIIFPPPLFK